jgi:hypothetical protein
MLNAATLLAILYPYHKTEKSSMLMKYFVLFTAIANAVGLYPATVGLVGADAYAGFNVNTLLIGIEVGMLLGYSFITFMDHKMFKVKAKHLWGFLYLIPMLLFIMMPYVPRALFGYASEVIVIDEFKPYHRIFIYFAFILQQELFWVIIFLFIWVLKVERVLPQRLVLYCPFIQPLFRWESYCFLEHSS